MKKNITNIWAVLYPIVFYYVISGFVFFALNLLIGEAQEIYMLKQMICSGATIPFLYTLWRQDLYTEEVIYGKNEKQPMQKVLAQIGLVAIGMGCLGIAINNMIAMTPLMDLSNGFQDANASFFAGRVWMEIAASCIVVPIAEELLFRGVVLHRIRLFTGMTGGVIFSAVLFGLVHVNLVQFLYATILGLFLAVVVGKTRNVWYAVIGHASANFIAILRAETGILEFSYELDLLGILFTVGVLVLGIVLIGMGLRLISYKK